MTTYGGPPPPPPAMPGGPTYQAPGGQISFDVIGEAWNLFKMQMGTWIGAIFLAFIAFGVVYGIGVTAMVIPMIAAGSAHSNGVAVGIGLTGYVVQFVFTFVIFTMMYFIMGGLLRMGIKQVRGENISIGDMFSVTDVLLPLLGASLLTVIIGQIGTLMCILPGLIAYGVLMFAIPLVVDQRLGAMAAVTQSFNMLKKDWLMATLFYFVVYLIGTVGFTACCVGGFFTAPVFILSVALTYRNYMMGGGAPVVPGGYMPTTPGSYVPTAPDGYTPPAPGSYMTGSDNAATAGYTPAPTITPGYAPTTPGYAPLAETPAPSLNNYDTSAIADNNGPTMADDSSSASLEKSPTLSLETPREDPPRL